MYMPALPSAHLENRVAALLAFTAGFVDVAGFVALFSLFTAHVTGNFVLIGAAVAGHGTGGLIAKLLALPVFVLAVALTRVLAGALEHHGTPVLAPALAVEAMLLLAMLAVGLAARPITDADAPLVMVTGMAGVAAMGIQNCLARLYLSSLPPTTIMTGNTTQAIIDTVDVMLGLPGASAAARARLRRSVPVLMWFVVGTSLGALSFAWLSFWCLTAPILALTLVIGTLMGHWP